MSADAQREAVARVLRTQEMLRRRSYSYDYAARADEIIAAYEAAAPRRSALTEKTIPELQAELGRIQMLLHAKVLGDPRESVTIGPPKDPSPWPSGCRDTASCARHARCMYLNCRHAGCEIAPAKDPAP